MFRFSKRVLAAIMVVVMLSSVTAYAAEYDLSAGSVIITGAAEGQTVTHGSNEAVVDNAPVITQSTETTENTITVDGSNAAANVTIQDVNIDTNSEAAAITTTGDASIVVSGDNTVASDDVAIDAEGSLTITGAADNGAGDTAAAESDETKVENTLTVEGGETGIDVDSAEGDGELVIGSEDSGDLNVTVEGGSVGIDANVTVESGDLNSYGDIPGNSGNTGIGIDGDLTVEAGAAGVYGDDFGVNGDASAAEDASAIVHSDGIAVSGSVSGNVTYADNNYYVPESTGTMFYSMDEDYGFDIKGTYDGSTHSTTYSNRGYETYLRVDGRAEKLDKPSGETLNNGLNVQVELKARNEGQLLQIVYTVTNTTNEAISFDMGTGADIKIGSDDYAAITPLTGNSGFKMINNSNESQFNFFGKGYQGVTSVDGFWYGKWGTEWSGYQSTTVFKTTPSDITGTYDSAASWCWLDEEIGANEVLTYTVLIGIGGANSEDVAGDTTYDDETPVESAAQPVYTGAGVVSVLDIKLDAIKEVIDLGKGTQGGRAMEKIAAKAESKTGALPGDASIVVHKVETPAEETIEDMPKENVGMAFTVSYIRNGAVSKLPGTVKLSIPAPEFSLDGYMLVFVNADGIYTEIPYELSNDEIVFETNSIGLYMLIKK